MSVPVFFVREAKDYAAEQAETCRRELKERIDRDQSAFAKEIRAILRINAPENTAAHQRNQANKNVPLC